MWKKLEAMKQTSFKQAHIDAYNRIVSSLERSLESEKETNALQEKRQKLLEQAEREQLNLKDSIYRHHFSVLQKQIEEKKRNKQIEDKEVLVEKELTDELFKPKRANMKEHLDAQVEEKQRLKREQMEKDAELDRLRLELARKSLESEMKRKSEGRQTLQNQLRESWERTQNTNKLQKAIERVRRFGDNYIIDSEEEDELAGDYKKDVGRDNERTFDKEKAFKSPDRSKHSDNFGSKMSKKRSKSVLSRLSKTSQQKVLEKINKLAEQEDKIKQEKLDILSYLESKTHSKASSRPVTVTTLKKPSFQPNSSL